MQWNEWCLLWEYGVVPGVKAAYNDICKAYPDYNLQCSIDAPGVCSVAYTHYETKKTDVHKGMFGASVDDKMDRHKICACVVWALLQTDFMQCTSTVKVPAAVTNAKYIAIFSGAVTVLYRLMLSDQLLRKSRGESNFKAKLSRYGIVFPATNAGHDLYATGKAKALAVCDISVHDDYWDVPAWASIFCDLERYNLELLACPHSGR